MVCIKQCQAPSDCVSVYVPACAVVSGSSGRLHPAGAGEGGSVSVGQQPGAGRCVPLAAGPSLQPAGGDPQPRPLGQVSTQRLERSL